MTSQHPSQHWNAQTYADNARFVADYGTSLIDWLAPQPQHRILDLGCGDGVLTRQIVASGATVMGVDGSADFVAAARAKGIDAVQADAHTLMFNAEFDAVFSNAALHWMTDADAVANNVFRGEKWWSLCSRNGRSRQYCVHPPSFATSSDTTWLEHDSMLVFSIASRIRHCA